MRKTKAQGPLGRTILVQLRYGGSHGDQPYYSPLSVVPRKVTPGQQRNDFFQGTTPPKGRRIFHLQPNVCLIGPEGMSEGKIMKEEFSISIQRAQRMLENPKNTGNGLMGRKKATAGVILNN